MTNMLFSLEIRFAINLNKCSINSLAIQSSVVHEFFLMNPSDSSIPF